MQKKYINGFTLTELVIALAIVAILTAIAVPSYFSYVRSTRRADGQTALMDLALRMDRYFTENNTYVGATLANVNMNAASPEGYYTLQISGTTATTYNIQAAPTGAQASDTDCGTLTYNQLGQKGITGTTSVDNCW